MKTKSYIKNASKATCLVASLMIFGTPIAQAANDRTPVPQGPWTISSNRCGFQIDVKVVKNKEYQDVKTLADGTTVTKITGNLVYRFTNYATGYTITRELSGPTTSTDHPDGSGTFVGTGNNFFTFGPVSQGNTGEPGLAFTSGLVVVEFAGGYATTFSLHGMQVNGCELLNH